MELRSRAWIPGNTLLERLAVSHKSFKISHDNRHLEEPSTVSLTPEWPMTKKERVPLIVKVEVCKINNTT